MRPRLDAVVLAGAATLAAAQVAFATQLGRPAALRVLPAVLAVALLAALRLAPVRRAGLAMVVGLGLLAAVGVEYALGRSQPRDGTLAARRGVAFDTRTRWDVIHEARSGGRDAYPAMPPRDRLTPGAATLALGGIGGKVTVFCNEGGAYTVYESDERGFANPGGIWGRGPVDVGIVGEAFAQGACVPAGASAADRIRARYPATVNVGMSGNGPLLDLAGIVEHLADVRPKVVLWLHYHNDLDALEAEKASALLRRYLETGARQGLAQDAVDRELAALAQREEATAPVWQAPLGLTRTATPRWIQDLVMGEQHGALSAVLRLDRLGAFATARLGRRQAGSPPDLALFEAVLAKAKATVASWGGALTFVYLADVHHLRGPEHPMRAAVLATVARVGLPLVDLQPVFAAVPDPMTLRYHAESHCNEAGYALIADTILAALAR